MNIRPLRVHPCSLVNAIPKTHCPKLVRFDLEKVKTVPEEARSHTNGWSNFPGANYLFIFADYLDWSWAYAIRPSIEVSQDNPVFLIGKTETSLEIAASFSDYVSLYLVDSPRLYGVNS